MAAAAKKIPEPSGAAFRRRAAPAVGWATVLLTFLLPLKFGSVAAVPEVPGYFPPEGWMYLLTDWSSNVWAILAGATLLAVLATEKEFRPDRFTVAGMVFLLAALPGWFAATGIDDHCWSITLHAAATGAWWCVAGLLVRRDPAWRQRLLAAVAAGCLVTGLLALRQYFFGFAEMRAFAEEQKAQGIGISDAVMAQIYDTRVRSTFTNNNMLAGYLLLTAPLAVVMMTRWGRRFTPERLSQILFCGTALGCTAVPFFLARSRGALAALALAALISGWLLPLRRSRKLLLAAATAALLLACAFLFQKGRGTLTLQSRLDYWRTSVLLTAERPLTGFGWGGFYLEHMRRKKLPSQEAARDPHNVAAAFAAQAGVVSALTVTVVLIWPLLGGWKRRRERDGVAAAVTFGALAFGLHLLVDVGWEVSALLPLYGTLLAAVAVPENAATPLSGWRKGAAIAVPGLLALAALAGGIVMLNGETALAALHERLYPESASLPYRPPTAFEVELLTREFNRRRPWSASAEETAGNFCLLAGELDRAAAHFRRAAALMPPHYSLEHSLFELAMKRGDTAAAVRHRARMLELFPTTQQLPPDPAAVRPAVPPPASALPATPSK